MWIAKQVFDTLRDDRKALFDSVLFERTGASRLSAVCSALREQKAKDDITIDWMRHRVNALEKQAVVLMMKAAGIALPVPEIVPTRPGTMTQAPEFDFSPSFEDVGDEESARLKIDHLDDGSIAYR